MIVESANSYFILYSRTGMFFPFKNRFTSPTV